MTRVWRSDPRTADLCPLAEMGAILPDWFGMGGEFPLSGRRARQGPLRAHFASPSPQTVQPRPSPAFSVMR